MSAAAWYLENANEGTEIIIDDFTKQFTLKWDNFRRARDYGIVCSRRKINKSGKKLIVGKRNV